MNREIGKHSDYIPWLAVLLCFSNDLVVASSTNRTFNCLDPSSGQLLTALKSGMLAMHNRSVWDDGSIDRNINNKDTDSSDLLYLIAIQINTAIRNMQLGSVGYGLSLSWICILFPKQIPNVSGFRCILRLPTS